jgi:hypothetical protein
MDVARNRVPLPFRLLISQRDTSSYFSNRECNSSNISICLSLGCFVVAVARSPSCREILFPNSTCDQCSSVSASDGQLSIRSRTIKDGPNSRSLGIAANPSDRLGLRGRTSHLGLHRGVERPPGRPQLRGKRRAELALKAPHQRLAHCIIMRWPNPKSGVLAT